MFRAANRSTSGAPNCICSLWYIYPCGDRPLSRLMHTKMHESMNIKFITEELLAFKKISAWWS